MIMTAAFARVLLQRSVLVLLAWTAATHPTNALALRHHRACNSRCVSQQQQQQQQQRQQRQHPSRRRFSVVVVAGALVSPFPVAAANPAGGAIRRGASSIPGYGPPDVVYPASFVGRWAVTKQTNDEVSETTRTISYDMRFLPTTSSEGAATTAAAIQDRGYNLVKETAAANKNNPVRSYEWTETNPNDLRLVLNDGTGMEIKVTKRSTETTSTEDDPVVTSSEFARITTDRGTIPVIEARRTLQKWKLVSANVVEGLEIVYDVGGKLGDPMAMSVITSSSASAGPRVISKSRLHLERIP